MSLEQSPSSGHSLNELTRLCEEAYKTEDWAEIEGEFDYTKFDSVRLCQDLRSAFELRYQLLRQPDAAGRMEKPPYLSTIRLKDPYISIPGGYPDGTDVRFTVAGDPSVEYLDILLHTGYDADGQPYTGPHFVGVFDTDLLDGSIFEGLELDGAEYTFITPVKDLVVSERHVPHIFN